MTNPAFGFFMFCLVAASVCAGIAFGMVSVGCLVFFSGLIIRQMACGN